METKQKTLGEKRVRVDFNVSNNSYLGEIKTLSAKLIDLIDSSAANPDWDDETFSEWKRLKALAMTSIEEGSMWSVKSITL